MDTEGQVSDPQSFDPFGVPRTTVPQDTGPLAALQDESMGYLGAYGRQGVYGSDMIHMGARVYDPASGRFTSRDVMPGTDMETQSQNPYAYGLNGPLRFYDLDGRNALTLPRDLAPLAPVAVPEALACLVNPWCVAGAIAVGVVIGGIYVIVNTDTGSPESDSTNGGSTRPNGVGGEQGPNGPVGKPKSPPKSSPRGTPRIKDLKRLPNKEAKDLDAHGLKENTGRSKSDLYYDKTNPGDLYSVPKNGGPPEYVGPRY